MILKKVEIPRCPHFKTRKRSLQFSLAKLQVLIIIQGVSFRFLEKNHNNWRSPSLPWNKNIYAFHPQKLEWNQHPFDPEWSQANRWPRPHLIPSPIHEDSTEAWAVTGHKRVMNHKGTKIISKGSCRGRCKQSLKKSRSEVILSSVLSNSLMVVYFPLSTHHWLNDANALFSCSSNRAWPQKPHLTEMNTIEEAKWSFPKPAMAYVWARSVLMKLGLSPTNRMVRRGDTIPRWYGLGATPLLGHERVGPLALKSHQSLVENILKVSEV